MFHVIPVTLSNITQLVLSHNKLSGKLPPPSSALTDNSSEFNLWNCAITFYNGRGAMSNLQQECLQDTNLFNNN